MQPRHIYTVYIFFNLGPGGPHKYSGGLVFDCKPIHVCYETSMENARETARRLQLTANTYIEAYFTGLTEGKAEFAVGRLRSLLQIEDHAEVLLEYIKVDRTKRTKRHPSEQHKQKISLALLGRKLSKPHRDKISNALAGRRKPTLRGNTHRANRMWIVTSPASREYFTSNLTGFCRDHDLSVSNLWSVANLDRRHWKWWRCRRVNWL